MIEIIGFISFLFAFISLLIALGLIIAFLVKRKFLNIIKTILIEVIIFYISISLFLSITFRGGIDTVLQTSSIFEALNWLIIHDGRFFNLTLSFLLLISSILFSIFWKDKKGYFDWNKDKHNEQLRDRL